MPLISNIRPVLLSAPYAKKKENLEVDLHLKSGFRTTGILEITCDNGIKGLGEGYLAVFAPEVFKAIVELITPHLIGKEITNIRKLLKEIGLITGYWSLQGAARHVYSAFEIAIVDCNAKLKGIPAFQFLSSNKVSYPINLYGSGGDSPTPDFMLKEFEYLQTLGIKKFKIRARKHQVNKAIWCVQKGHTFGVDIAIDMTQNLANPGNSSLDVISFYNAIYKKTAVELFFLEEVLGTDNHEQHTELIEKLSVNIAGGEIVTTPQELIERIKHGWYNIVQPDATVIGGMHDVLNIFDVAKNKKTEVLVHCWGGPVGMMANYHAAMAGGGEWAEWPMPVYPLRHEMLEEPWSIENGKLTLSQVPGLGVKLTKEIEQKYKFREDAVYSCLVDDSIVPKDEIWI